MKGILRTFFFLFSIIFATVVHLAAVYVLPYPFSRINVIFLLLLILLMVWESGWVVWLGFLAHFIIELFSLTPFGVVLFSATMSILMAYWLYRHVFTNRSWFTSIALCLAALVSYRMLYILLVIGVISIDDTLTVSMRSLLVPFGWELLFTTISMAVCYLILALLSKRFHLSA